MLQLALVPIIAGFAVLLNGCSGKDDRPEPLSDGIDGPPETPPDNPPETPPDDIPRGDGTYRLRPGEAIQASNGIRIVMGIQARKANADQPEYTHDLLFTTTLGNDPTLLTDYPYAVMIGPESDPSVPCFKILESLELDVLEADMESDPPEVLVKIRSLLTKPAQDRTDIAEHCLSVKPGDVEGCSAAIPDAPFSFETQFGDTFIAVQSPSGFFDDLAQLRVRQIRESTDALASWLGIEPAITPIGYRLFSDIRMQTGKSIKAKPNDPLTLVCHELTHLHLYGANIPLWMNEGIAQYVQEHLPLQLQENRPWTVVESLDTTVGTQNAYGFRLEAISDVGETITVTLDTSPAETFDVPIPGAFITPTNHIAVAERSEAGAISLNIYDGAELVSGRTAYTTCLEGKAELSNAISVDDQRLVPLVDVASTPLEADFASVATSSDPVAIYGGGACFWESFIDRYGHGKLRELFAQLHVQRSAIAAGGSDPWCLLPIFESVAGNDVRSLLATFGATDETLPCRPPRIALELIPPPEDPASVKQCETSILPGTHE